MKPSKLMIGDWIWIDGQAIQVKSNSGEEILNESGSYPYTSDDIEPIRLTSEIYKANNLTNPDGRFMIFDTDNWYFRIGEWLEENALNEKFTKLKIPEKTRPTYVHELQQLFRIFGINKNIIV